MYTFLFGINVCYLFLNLIYIIFLFEDHHSIILQVNQHLQYDLADIIIKIYLAILYV